MTTKSLVFLALFMTVVLLVYALVPKKGRWIVLLAASWLFYFISSRLIGLFLPLTILSVYLCGLWISRQNALFGARKQGLEKEEKQKLKKTFARRKKGIVALAVLFNLAALAALKYLGFFTQNLNALFSALHFGFSLPLVRIMMPLGISYYTLQAIGYIVDVYRGKYAADRNLGRVALFLSYFPQMVEGPIGRYDALAGQLYEGHDFEYNNFTRGLQLFLWGLIKKLVIADRLNILVAEVFGNYSAYSGIVVFGAVVFFTMQIYAEFSGFIDMVTGASEMFGIKLAKNFERPFFARNVNEFWRRWHITLGAWLRDYVFYPVSLSRPVQAMSKGLRRRNHTYLMTVLPAGVALLCVWLANGLWHGAAWQYIVYGLYYYVVIMLGMCFEPLFKKIPFREKKWYRVFQIARTFLLVNLGMLIFRASGLGGAAGMLGQLFQSGGIVDVVGHKVIDLPDLIMSILGILVLLGVDLMQEKGVCLRDVIGRQKLALRWSVFAAAILVVVIFGAYGPGYLPVDPIYAQF